jgi:protein-tyrosine phosphatase
LIDIHSHVLYGMDDGAPTLEVSVAMARMAAERGTTDLVATPHANPNYQFEPDVIAARLAEISAACGDSIRLHSGCDFHLSFDNIQDALTNPYKYSINHKRYLLVEFSDLVIFQNTNNIFDRLIDAGLTPIITHPERNGLLRQRIEEISTWADNGVLVQVTAQSITGDFGRRAQDFCRALMQRGLVHFVASDAHDTEHRPPRMDLAHAWLAEQYDESIAEILCVLNPGAALTGDSLPETRVEVAPVSRKWYHFWK